MAAKAHVSSTRKSLVPTDSDLHNCFTEALSSTTIVSLLALLRSHVCHLAIGPVQHLPQLLSSDYSCVSSI
jgi:hypothetical protein